MPMRFDAPRLRRFLDWLIGLRGSPEAIALGVAIGMVVAFTPTIGFQAIIALGLATLFIANRPISIVPIWLTNPLTIPPIYGFTYYLGSFFVQGPEQERVAQGMHDVALELRTLDFLALRNQFGLFLELGEEVFFAMWIGGLIVGAIAAAVSYPVTLRTVSVLRARRERHRRLRTRKRPRLSR